MASSSTASTKWKYDVFLSFRGEDTRTNFVSHLYKALYQRGIHIFKDDEKIQKGQSISRELLEAIQLSTISLVVLSENYASSSWCLEELVTILECRDKMGQEVVPIFYNVDPSDVRKHRGSFAEAFSKHVRHFTMKTLQTWREALSSIAEISGWDSRLRYEARLIDNIVEDIWSKLSHTYCSDTTGLIGVNNRSEELRSLLSIGSNNICFVGVWGMGGVGKTAIARATYNRSAPNFEGCCFLANVREESKMHNMVYLQKYLLSEILKDKKININSVDEGITWIKNRLKNLRVLIVLDDVDDRDLLESLAGEANWFGEGSKIIITTRDKEVLVGITNKIYEERGLTTEESLMLFSLRAFKQTNPCEGFVELSNMVINCTKGNPLALRVLGSFLFGKTKKEWESALDKLKRIPHAKIFDVLKISFDGLPDEERRVFLDVACFFKGKDKSIVVEILNCCGYFPEITFRILSDRCLMSISYERLWMHDLIQEMGWEIVRREAIEEPGERSRLCFYEDIYHVLSTNTGTKNIKGLALESLAVKDVCINYSSFSDMHGLRLLIFENIDVSQDSCEGLETLPRALKYMRWARYPYNCLPTGFYIKNLVVVDMPQSHIKQLWTEHQWPLKLKILNLSFSKHLASIPDLSPATNLEKLVLNGCNNLLDVHCSVGYLKKLRVLNLEGCTKLQSFPTCISSNSLRIFILSGCQKLKIFPEISCQMEHLLELPLDDTSIEEMPSSIGNLKGLLNLSMKNCRMIKHLPNNICNLRHLKTLILSGCSKLENLPENIGNLKSLEALEVCGTAINQVPTSIACLNNLRELSFAGCKGMVALYLHSSYQHLPLLSLRRLDLSDCNLIHVTSTIGCLSNLRYLSMSGNNFRSLPESIRQLLSLENLCLTHCTELQILPSLPANIRKVDACNCTLLEGISQSFDCFTRPHLDIEEIGRPVILLYNCPRLVQHTRGSFMLEAVKNFHLMQVRLKESYRSQYVFLGWPQLSLCFPGDDVPECWSHISLGDKVTIELPLDFLTNPCRGLAICAAISLEEPLAAGCNVGRGLMSEFSDGSLTVNCNIITTYSRKTFTNFFQWDLSALCDDQKWRDHVFLGYISCSRLHFLAQMTEGHWVPQAVLRGELCFQIHGSLRYVVKVKSCGVHLMPQDSDIRRLAESGSSSKASTSLGIDAETAGILKRSHDGLSRSEAELSKEGYYEQEPDAKRPKELEYYSDFDWE